MMLRPPRLAARLLARALRDDPAAPAILGDLHEDFVARATRRGAASARRWYRRETALLVLDRLGRALLAPFTGSTPMHDLLRREGFVHDTGAALRTVRRAPGLVLLLALVVGLGVGATTAVFSVLTPLMLAPLPFEDPGALVWIANDGERASLSSVTSRSSNLRDFRASSRSFEGITGYNAFFNQSTYTLVGDGPPEQLMGVGVAHDFLDVLGVEPIHGRGFSVEEGRWGGPPAVILAHGYWRRRFAADPAIVGSSITLDGVPRSVVGVLPPSFDFSSVFTPGIHVDVLLPFPVSAETDRWGNTMSFIGRLRPAVTDEAAQHELDAIVASLQEADPERWGLAARVSPLQEYIAGPFRSALLLLATAAGAVMLIVCVNVANVLLARSPARGREVAVRKALGATRGRIVRQLLLESLMVSLAGGLVGVALAVLATRFVAGTTGIDIPMLDRVAVNGPALAFALAVAVLVGLVAGLAPALQVAEGREAATLGASTRGASASRAGRRLRETLVVAELALACVLLVCGGLLLRSFQAVLDVELGFEPEQAVAWQLNPSRDFDSMAEEASFYAELTAAVRAIPGVEAVGMSDALPLGKNRTWGFSVVGEEGHVADEGVTFFPHMIDPGYLHAMRIPLVAGRDLHPDDAGGSADVLLINESGANAVFPDGDAVGRQVMTWGQRTWEVVGVVADVRHLSPERGSGIEVYFPMAQMWDYQTMELVVRSRLPATTLAPSVGAVLAEIDPAMPTHAFWTLASTLERSVSPRRFTLQVLGAFGAVALVLAGLGIYGVLSQSVSERTRELGIRMALGASAGEIRRSVVGRTLLLSGAGVGIGLLILVPGTRLLASLLFGVPAADPVTLLTIAGVLVGVAALSGLLPALRASRADGLRVLRGE
jgi:predicted permease